MFPLFRLIVKFYSTNRLLKCTCFPLWLNCDSFLTKERSGCKQVISDVVSYLSYVVLEACRIWTPYLTHLYFIFNLFSISFHFQFRFIFNPFLCSFIFISFSFHFRFIFSLLFLLVVIACYVCQTNVCLFYL